MATHSRRRPTGFTLIEVVVTIGIIGILSAIVINGLGGLTQKAGVNNFLGELALDVQGARMFAAQRGRNVFVFLRFENTPDPKESGYAVLLDTGSTPLSAGDVLNSGSLDPARQTLPDGGAVRVLGGRRLQRANLLSTNGFGVLTTPYASIPAVAGLPFPFNSAVPPSSNTAACTFCTGGDVTPSTNTATPSFMDTASSGGGSSTDTALRAVIVVTPDQRVLFSDGSSGGVVGISDTTKRNKNFAALVLVGPSGMVKLVSQ